MAPDDNASSVPPVAREFLTTHWSVVLLAGQQETSRAQEALGHLCQTYWYPLYAYIRRQGYSPHDAEDLTQAFFAKLLQKNYLADARQEKGRFRFFLLAALKHFLINEWDRAQALKRGGGKSIVSLDAQAAEARYALEPVENVTAETVYERRWATLLLERVLEQLRQDYTAAGNEALFGHLKQCLAGSREVIPYAQLGTDLGMTEGAIKAAVHRLRQLYRELLRREIAQTVATREEIDDELRHLFVVLGG